MAVLAISFVFVFFTLTTVNGGVAKEDHANVSKIFIPEFQDEKALCDVCVVIVNRLDIFLHEGTTKDRIDKMLKNICDMMKGDLTMECHKAIPEIEDALSRHLNGQTVCGIVELCSKAPSLATDIVQSLREDSVNADHRSKRQVSERIISRLTNRLFNGRFPRLQNGFLCDMCKSVFNSTESAVVNPIVELIINVADEICGHLPDPTKKACTDTINHYVPVWSHELLDKFSPEVICTFIRLCTPPKDKRG